MPDRYDIIQGQIPEPKDDEKEVQPKTPSSDYFLGRPINTHMIMRPLGGSEGVAVSLDSLSLTYDSQGNILVNTEFRLTTEKAKVLFEDPMGQYPRPPDERVDNIATRPWPPLRMDE